MPDRTIIHAEGETDGIAWQVCTIPHMAGYRWRIRVPSDHLGGWRWHESSGAFYDGAEDHPEGGIAWATSAVKRYLARKR